MKKTVSIDGQIVSDENAKISVLRSRALVRRWSVRRHSRARWTHLPYRATPRPLAARRARARARATIRYRATSAHRDRHRARLPDSARRACPLLVTRGEGPLDVDPTTCKKLSPTVVHASWPRLACSARNSARRASPCSPRAIRRPDPNVQDVAVKTLNYLGSALAKQEVRQRGGDEALLLNQSGHVAEAAVADIFALRGRSLFTPPPLDGCLEEHQSRRGLRDCAGFGLLRRQRRSMGRRDLFAADEVFLAGSGAGVIGVRSVDRPRDWSRAHGVR